MDKDVPKISPKKLPPIIFNEKKSDRGALTKLAHTFKKNSILYTTFSIVLDTKKELIISVKVVISTNVGVMLKSRQVTRVSLLHMN